MTALMNGVLDALLERAYDTARVLEQVLARTHADPTAAYTADEWRSIAIQRTEQLVRLNEVYGTVVLQTQDLLCRYFNEPGNGFTELNKALQALKEEAE